MNWTTTQSRRDSSRDIDAGRRQRARTQAPSDESRTDASAGDSPLSRFASGGTVRTKNALPVQAEPRWMYRRLAPSPRACAVKRSSHESPGGSEKRASRNTGDGGSSTRRTSNVYRSPMATPLPAGAISARGVNSAPAGAAVCIAGSVASCGLQDALATVSRRTMRCTSRAARPWPKAGG